MGGLMHIIQTQIHKSENALQNRKIFKFWSMKPKSMLLWRHEHYENRNIPACILPQFKKVFTFYVHETPKHVLGSSCTLYKSKYTSMSMLTLFM